MNRVYRLLRKNIEYGPFTIDELLGQQLHPSDMLWVEGQSTAWCKLSEIELKPSENEPAASPLPEGRIRSRTSSDEIEKKAEIIRKKVLAFKPHTLPVAEEIVSDNERHYYIETASNETIELVDHRKQKSTMLNDVMMTGLIVALFAGGLYVGRMFINTSTVQAKQAGVSRTTSDDHAAKAISEPAFGETSILATDSLRYNDSTSNQAFQVQQPLGLNQTATVAKREAAAQPSEDTTNTTVAAVIPEEPPVVQPLVVQPKPKKDTELVVKKTDPAKERSQKEQEKETVEEEQPEKKKGFFKKLFGKKKKDNADDEAEG